MPDTPEKRKFLRLKTSQVTQLREEPGRENAGPLNIGNLSKGGVFLETETPFQEGASISFQLRLPNFNGDIQVQGVVRRVQESDPKGIGVEFKSVGGTEEELAALQTFVDAYEAEM